MLWSRVAKRKEVLFSAHTFLCQHSFLSSHSHSPLNSCFVLHSKLLSTHERKPRETFEHSVSFNVRGMKSDMRGKIFWLNPSKGVWYHHYLRFDREHQCDATAKQMHSKLFTWFLFFKLAMIFWEMATSRRNSSHGKSVSLWLYRKSICRLHWKLLTGLVVWQCICGGP